MREGLRDADIVMMLRLQRERMNGSFVPSTQEYFHYFGLDEKKLAYAKPDALVMHPGPMNRGVEIDYRGRRRRPVADPRAGRDGRGGAHGGARGAVAEPAECVTARSQMITERRPILLANARILDPSRDLDIDGDLLIADGVIREAKRGIGAAGVPEGTEVIDCRGRLVAPGLIDMRAFVGEPGAEYRETLASASQAAAAGGVTTIVCQPDTSPVIDDPAIVDFVLRRARDTAIVHVQPMAALTKGLRGEEMAEIGLLKAAGAVAFTRRREKRRQCAGHAPGADLCARFRRADRASHRGPRPGRRRRHERRRVRRPPRPLRRSEGGRDHHARARHSPRRARREPAITRPRSPARSRSTCSGAPRRRASRSRPPRRSIISRSTRSTSGPTAPSSSSARRCAPRTTAPRWSPRSPRASSTW